MTRYYRTENRNPREDMLTQALAGSLSSVPDLPAWLMLKMLDGLEAQGSGWQTVEEELRVKLKQVEDTNRSIRTQIRRGGDIVDLGVCFGDEVAIWIENKTGSDLGKEQLTRYATKLEREPFVTKALILLAPIGFEHEVELPWFAAKASWGQVGVCLQEWIDKTESHPEKYDYWLVAQFLNHLREEGLLSADPLTETTIKTGKDFPSFHGQLNQFLSDLETQVDKWSKKQGQPFSKGSANKRSWPRRQRITNIDFGLDINLGEPRWLEWRIGENPNSDWDRRDQALTLAAGIGFSKAYAGALDQFSLREELQQTNPKLDLYPDFEGQAWILGSEDLWEVLGKAQKKYADSYDEQVAYVCRWIVHRFEGALDQCAPGKLRISS